MSRLAVSAEPRVPLLTGLVVLAWLGANLVLFAVDGGVERIGEDRRIGRLATAAERRPAVWAGDPALARALAALEPRLEQVRQIAPERVFLPVPARANLLVSAARHVLFPAEVIPHNVEARPLRDLRAAAEAEGAAVILLFQPPEDWQVIVLAERGG